MSFDQPRKEKTEKKEKVKNLGSSKQPNQKLMPLAKFLGKERPWYQTYFLAILIMSVVVVLFIIRMKISDNGQLAMFKEFIEIFTKK